MLRHVLEEIQENEDSNQRTIAALGAVGCCQLVIVSGMFWINIKNKSRDCSFTNYFFSERTEVLFVCPEARRFVKIQM